MTIYSAHTGNNADLIRAVTELYVADGAVVADVTWGKGAFWRKTDTSRFTLLRSDLMSADPGVPAYDFRCLPYADGSVDVVVLDPPYVHNPGSKGLRHVTDARYGNADTTAGMYNADILGLYGEGMAEAYRVLRPDGGQLWVKCKDEVEAGVQRWSHIYLYQMALELGFCARDLFVIIPDSRTTSNRWKRQLHARKNHSFLWILQRPDREYRMLLGREPPSAARRRG